MVHVIGTGGTIAADVRDGTIRLRSAAELVDALPGDAADIVTVDLARIPSASITPAQMLSVAQASIGALDAGADGVVVTHGTDTLEETAYLADLLLGSARRGAIVFTGAMRPASDPDPDGPQNLAAAVALARHPLAEALGAVVCFAGQIHAARWVTKTDTASLAAFASPGVGPIGTIDAATGVVVGSVPARDWSGGQDAILDVALISAYPGIDPVLLDAIVDAGAVGVVVEGFGVMNLPDTLLPGVVRARQRDVAVIVASRARTRGGLDQGPTGHRRLHALGCVGSYGLPAHKARVALMVGLAHTDRTPGQLCSWMQTLGDAVGGFRRAAASDT